MRSPARDEEAGAGLLVPLVLDVANERRAQVRFPHGALLIHQRRVCRHGRRAAAGVLTASQDRGSSGGGRRRGALHILLQPEMREGTHTHRDLD